MSREPYSFLGRWEGAARKRQKAFRHQVVFRRENKEIDTVVFCRVESTVLIKFGLEYEWVIVENVQYIQQ